MVGMKAWWGVEWRGCWVVGITPHARGPHLQKKLYVWFDDDVE